MFKGFCVTDNYYCSKCDHAGFLGHIEIKVYGDQKYGLSKEI